MGAETVVAFEVERRMKSRCQDMMHIRDMGYV